GTDVEVRGQEGGREEGEEARLVAGRDADKVPGLRRGRGDGRREAGAGNPCPGAARNHRLQRLADGRDEPWLGTPEAFEPIDLGLEQAERAVPRVRGAGERRAVGREPLEGGLGRGSVSLR